MAIDLVMAMRVFHAVVEAGSFAGAADRLELSRGMATRYVAQLEEHLRVRLLHRTTRSVSLTTQGHDYHRRSAQILALIEEAEAAAAEESAAPTGMLRITSPAILGPLLNTWAGDWLRAHPQVALEVSFSERVVDVVEEGFDLALRISRQVDPGLIARPLLRFSMVACASPAYLRERGEPVVPEDLQHHNCLHFPRSPVRNEWLFTRAGERHVVHVRGNLRANNGVLLVDAAIAGGGIAFEPGFLVADAIARGDLRQVLADWQTESAALYAVWANRKFLPPKVRSFVDFVAARAAPLSAPPSRPA